MNRTGNLKLAMERLKEAQQLLSLAIEKGSISNIDRDLLLEKLRSAYDKILFEEEQEKVVVASPTIHQVKVEKVPEVPSKPSKPEIKPQANDESEPVLPKAEEAETAKPSKTFERTSIFETSKTAKKDEKLVEDLKPKEQSILKVHQPESIAEKFQGKRKSMTDSLSNQLNAKPIASQLQDKPIHDLTKEIGVHDKFLFIKELFDNDSALYEETINKLNGYNDITEALIFLQENFNWDDSSKAANRFIDLIRRKLLKS